MATIKHLSSKNANYAAAESYLTFQHNEYTGLPILDEQGKPVLRDSYLLDTLECGESTFAMACLLANRKYGKNDKPEDVKTHHYIISFDPRDAADNGLTPEKVQALGLQGQLSRASRHRLHPPGRAQWYRQSPCPHRDRQSACPHRRTAALHGQAVRLAGG